MLLSAPSSLALYVLSAVLATTAAEAVPQRHAGSHNSHNGRGLHARAVPKFDLDSRRHLMGRHLGAHKQNDSAPKDISVFQRNQVKARSPVKKKAKRQGPSVLPTTTTVTPTITYDTRFVYTTTATSFGVTTQTSVATVLNTIYSTSTTSTTSTSLSTQFATYYSTSTGYSQSVGTSQQCSGLIFQRCSNVAYTTSVPYTTSIQSITSTVGTVTYLSTRAIGTGTYTSTSTSLSTSLLPSTTATSFGVSSSQLPYAVTTTATVTGTSTSLSTLYSASVSASVGYSTSVSTSTSYNWLGQVVGRYLVTQSIPTNTVYSTSLVPTGTTNILSVYTSTATLTYTTTPGAAATPQQVDAGSNDGSQAQAGSSASAGSGASCTCNNGKPGWLILFVCICI